MTGSQLRPLGNRSAEAGRPTISGRPNRQFMETPDDPKSASLSAHRSKPSGKMSARWGNKRWHAGALTYTTGGLFLLFFWLLSGDFGFQFKERTVLPTLQLLLRKFEVSDLVTGLLVLSLPQVIAIVANPVFGYLSD